MSSYIVYEVCDYSKQKLQLKYSGTKENEPYAHYMECIFDIRPEGVILKLKSIYYNIV